MSQNWFPRSLEARYGNGTPAWQEHATARYAWYHMRHCERALARCTGTIFDQYWQSINQDRAVLGLPSLEDVMARELAEYRESGQAQRDGWARRDPRHGDQLDRAYMAREYMEECISKPGLHG